MKLDPKAIGFFLLFAATALWLANLGLPFGSLEHVLGVTSASALLALSLWRRAAWPRLMPRRSRRTASEAHAVAVCLTTGLRHPLVTRDVSAHGIGAILHARSGAGAMAQATEYGKIELELDVDHPPVAARVAWMRSSGPLLEFGFELREAREPSAALPESLARRWLFRFAVLTALIVAIAAPLRAILRLSLRL